jgi:hypothetical protein
MYNFIAAMDNDISRKNMLIINRSVTKGINKAKIDKP